MTRIINTIGWQTPWLRHVLRFCCRELGYDLNKVTVANFLLAHRNRTYSGWARYVDHTICVKVSPLAEYPLKSRPLLSLPELVEVDATEVLVHVTAHELAHLERYDRCVKKLRAQGKRDTYLERDTDQMARLVLQAFRQDRDNLLARWGDAGPGPVPPPFIHRLTCRRCHRCWETSSPPKERHRRHCKICFYSWQHAASIGEYLTYERLDRNAGAANPAQKTLDTNAQDAAA